MPDTREKLIELLYQCVSQNMKPQIIGDKLTIDIEQGNIADHLIDNGVTVQDSKGVEIDQFNRWIPVSERLPRNYISVLAYVPNQAPCPTVHEAYIGGDGEWHSAYVYGIENEDVTHWMLLPEPPKEELP